MFIVFAAEYAFVEDVMACTVVTLILSLIALVLLLVTLGIYLIAKKSGTLSTKSNIFLFLGVIVILAACEYIIIFIKKYKI